MEKLKMTWKEMEKEAKNVWHGDTIRDTSNLSVTCLTGQFS